MTSLSYESPNLVPTETITSLSINSIEADKFFARYPETLDFGILRNILCGIYCRIDLTTFIEVSNANGSRAAAGAHQISGELLWLVSDGYSRSYFYC